MPLGIRKSTKVVFSVLLFLVVVMAGAAWLSVGDCVGLFQRSYHTIVLGDKDFIARKVRFKARINGTLLLPSGRLGGFTTVRASDCVKVTSEAQDEGTPLKAVDEMEKRIREASGVIERSPIRDGHGEVIGERVVLVRVEQKAEIISLHKGESKLYVVQSNSLAHALAYEELVRSGYRLDPDGYVIAQGE